ncbi:hypothetical protein [Streptomyces sp. NPDC002537]
MNATQQHMLDLYRTAQHHEPAPSSPGEGELRLIREFRTWRDFRAVVDERAAARRARRRALLRLLLPGALPRQETRTPARPAGRPAAAAPAPDALSACASGARRHPGQKGTDRLDDRLGRPAQG